VSDTEKISINVGAVDLGTIDLLVDQGLYANRTDLIRTAIRNQLDRHADVVEKAVSRHSMVIGVVRLNRTELEARVKMSEKLRLSLVGVLRIGSDVSPELASSAIDRIQIFGVIRASDDVKEALSDRIQQFATLYSK